MLSWPVFPTDSSSNPEAFDRDRLHSADHLHHSEACFSSGQVSQISRYQEIILVTGNWAQALGALCLWHLPLFYSFFYSFILWIFSEYWCLLKCRQRLVTILGARTVEWTKQMKVLPFRSLQFSVGGGERDSEWVCVCVCEIVTSAREKHKSMSMLGWSHPGGI